MVRGMKAVEISRNPGGQDWRPFATVDPNDESTWPRKLPDDIAGLIRDGETENNSKHSPDGFFYRLHNVENDEPNLPRGNDLR